MVWYGPATLRCIVCIRSLETLCERDTSKMYSMHKKCLIVEDTTVTLCEIDTSKMYNMHKKCFNNRGYTTVR